MKKTIAIFVIVTLTCLLTWKFVQSDGHEQPMSAMDESKVILVEYKWNGKPYQISLADLNAAIAELPFIVNRTMRLGKTKPSILRN